MFTLEGFFLPPLHLKNVPDNMDVDELFCCALLTVGLLGHERTWYYHIEKNKF